MNLTKTQQRDLRELIDYAWHDEQRSHQELREDGIDTRHHIFHRLRRLQQALENAAPTEIVVLVSGGVCQAVRSTDKTLNATVLDCDGDLAEVNGAKWDAVDADPKFHPIL